ncbi:hypothetical protein GCM10017774_28930 [Lentzea cavernae]|uniref:Uncharacterized protein n=1 Tax=Lentzea cavernae TaxID=2020703 RepID=A0ABQ3MBJ4_9PSEU|nr:hypothetical protein GCM10017774_28930 [Lentzea cavernae]
MRHPEPNVYLVGMNSHGHAPTDRVELVPPELGVCGGAGVFDAPEDQKGGCDVTIGLVPGVR